MSGFCVNCGTSLPENAGFCPKCGTKVEIPRCPACGKEIDYGMDFCIYCGNSLTTKKDEPSTPIHLPGSEPQPEVPAENSAQGMESAAPSRQDLPTEPPQNGERTHNDDDARQFSWSYVRMGALGVRRYDITATLTAETLQVKEQKRFGWKPTSNETDIALTDIQQVHISSKASFLYWGLFAALVTLGVVAFVVGALNSTACVLLALFAAVYAWLGSFQLLHNELVIADHSGKETVLKGGKRELLQQLEHELTNRAGIGPKEFQSAAGIIILAITAGIAVIIGFILLAGDGRLTPAHEIEEKLIGEWGVQYVEDNGTAVYSYDIFLAQGYTDEEIKLLFSNNYIQFFDNHSFEWVLCDETGYSESVYGTWKANGVNGKNVTLKSSDGEVKGYLGGDYLYFKSDTFFIKTSAFELARIRNLMRDEEIYKQPDYEAFESSEPSKEPFATSFSIPYRLYQAISEKTLFPVRDAYYAKYDEPAQVGMLSCDSIYFDWSGEWYDTVSFAVVDMDGDGENEIILSGDSGFDGLYTVMHEYEGSVYGYTVGYRGMTPLLTNGLFGSSSGASDFHISRFEFYEDNASVWDLACELYQDENSYYIFEAQVSQEEYENYLSEIGWDWNNEAVFYEFTDANIQNLLAPQ